MTAALVILQVPSQVPALARAVPSTVAAATYQIGQVAPAAAAPNGQCTGCTLFQSQTVAASPSYAAPADGTITTWNVMGPSGGCAGCTVKLRVFRDLGNGTYVTVGESALQSVGAGLQTYTTNIAVRAGDRIGVDATDGIRWYGGNAGDVMTFITGDPTTGTTTVGPCPSGPVPSFCTFSGAGLVNVQATLVAMYRISGMVFDPNGATVPNLAVRVTDRNGGATVATTTTNADGFYSVSVRDGSYDVAFLPTQGSGAAVQYYNGQISTLTANAVDVNGADRTGIDAHLVPGRAVTGRVTDPTGAPLAGIPVDAYLGGPSCCYLVRSTTTDANGQFLLELADGATYKVRYARTTPREQWWNGHRDPTNDVVAGWNSADAFAVATTTTTTGTITGCQPNAQAVISYTNWNTGAVTGGGTSPTFSVSSNLCAMEIDDYHWNNGNGATPGTIGLQQLIGGNNLYGPIQATGSDPQGNLATPYVNWSIRPTQGTVIWLLQSGSTYRCLDSDSATWSQNSQSNGQGFCQVWTVPYGTFTTTTTTTTYGHANTDAILANNIVTGIAECRYTNGDGVSTLLLPGALVQLYSGSALLATTTANDMQSGTPAAYFFARTAPNSTYTVRYTGFPYFPPLNTDVLVLVKPTAISCDVTFRTDAYGNAIVPEPTPLLDRLNHLWFRPYHLHPGVPTVDVIPVPGMSTWYRVTVKPHQRLTFRLTNPPTQYTVLAFTDLFAVAKQLLQAGGTLESLRLLDNTQDRSAPDLDSPDLDSPDLDSPDLDSPDLDSPDLDSPDLDSPDLDSPDLDSPDLDSPDLDSPDLDSPDLDSGGNTVPAAQEVVTYGSVYVAAQRHGLRAFSAHAGTVPQTIVMNTRDYQGDVYFRVRAHGDLASSDTFTVTATTEGGAGCTNAPLVLRSPVAPVFPAGAKKTLVLTNTGTSWFTAQNTVTKASLSSALASFAQRSEVNGVVVDLASDPNLALSFADWAANPTCVAQANVVARSVKQLIDLYRAHYGLDYLVIAAPDPGIPFFRTRDDAELSKESRYSGGLDALSPLETALTEDYVLTDSFYGATGPTTRSGHDFYLSDIAIGRLVETPSDIVSYLTAYASANGGVSLQRALSTGYGFVSDLASYDTSAFTHAGATVDTLNNDTWSSDDLRGFLFGAQHYQVFSLQGHGRADRLVPANGGARLLSSEISAVNDGRFAGTFVMSLACHYTGYDLVRGQQLPDSQVISFPSAFAAQGATAIGETGFGYGHEPLLKNGEVVMADLADELSYNADLSGVAYGPRGVPVGKALNIAKLRFLNSLADVRGIEAKVINETVVYGAPMFAVKTPNTFARPVAPSAVGPLATLTGTLASGDVAQSFDFGALHKHTLGAGSFFDAGTLNDTATFAFRPIVPSRVVGVQAANTLPRGAVFLSGTYQDTPGFVPALAIPATQDGTANPPTTYTSTSFAPGRLIRLEEFAGDAAVFVPFQFQGNGASGTARTFSNITAKLYYSTLTGDAALVDAPGIVSVAVTRDVDGGGNPTGLVRVTVTLSSRTTPDIQDVWETFTATSGPLAGQWQSTLLTAGATTLGRAGTFTRSYTGTIDPQGAPVTSVLVDVQAVGGNGLVSYATNGGLHFGIVDQTATTSAPKRAPLVTLSALATATYRSRIAVSATVSDLGTGAAIANKKVTFKLGGSYASAMTNAAGLATAVLVANVPPDPSPYRIVASVSEDLDMLAGGVEAPITVQPGPTQLVPLANITFDCSGGAVVATLRLSSRNTPLPDERVTIDLGGGRHTQTYTDRNGGVRLDAGDFGKLAAGMYTASLSYAGQNLAHPELSRFAASSASVAVKVTEKATVALNTPPQPGTAPVTFGGAVQQGAALDPACLLGDITTAVVHYVVTSEGGAVVASGDAPVAANGSTGDGTWSVTTSLPAGVYTVAANATGFYTSPTVTGILAVFDPSTFVTGGGYVVTSSTNSSGLVLGKKANFGFNLKYKTGTTTPTGSLLFQAAESKVDFKATTFDWMVITTLGTGHRAEFQGTGTVNGSAGWQFHAVATDAGSFEIRITNATTGASYFVSGTSSGGSIVIH